MSTYYIANWKMNEGKPTSERLVRLLVQKSKTLARNKKVVVCPPFTSIPSLVPLIRKSRISLGAQDMFWEEHGPYTGEVSPRVLKKIGVSYVIIGHSERKRFFYETDATINKKIKAALVHGLVPILCIGETAKEKREGKTARVLTKQLARALQNINCTGKHLIIAYEPVWAISTSRKKLPVAIQEISQTITMLKKARTVIASHSKRGPSISWLYGGSVTEKNAGAIVHSPHVDGVLVGAASLECTKFYTILNL